MVTLESLDLGDTLVSDDVALQAFKEAAAKTGLDEKVAIFLVKTVGCRTLEDLEQMSDATVDDKIIASIADLLQPIVQGSRLKKLIKAVQQASEATDTVTALLKDRARLCTAVEITDLVSKVACLACCIVCVVVVCCVFVVFACGAFAMDVRVR